MADYQVKITPDELEKAKKKRHRRDKEEEMRRRIILVICLIMFLHFVFVVGGYRMWEVWNISLLLYRDEAIETVADSSPENFRQDETSIVYDADGKKLREVTGEKEVYYKT